MDLHPQPREYEQIHEIKHLKCDQLGYVPHTTIPACLNHLYFNYKRGSGIDFIIIFITYNINQRKFDNCNCCKNSQ